MSVAPWWDPQARALTTAEAAASAGVSEAVIRRWASDGVLTAVAWQPTRSGRGGRRGMQPLYRESEVLTAEARAATAPARSGATRRGKPRHVAQRPDGVTQSDQSG